MHGALRFDPWELVLLQELMKKMLTYWTCHQSGGHRCLIDRNAYKIVVSSIRFLMGGHGSVNVYKIVLLHVVWVGNILIWIIFWCNNRKNRDKLALTCGLENTIKLFMD